MDNLDLGTLIAGAIVPFILSLLKRWVILTKEQMGVLVLAICFIIASVFELVENNFSWEGYVAKIMTVYSTSQIIYWSILKTLELDSRIEGK